MESEDSLLVRLGGVDTVNSAIDIFYSKVLADERINAFFLNTDMSKQKDKLKIFLSYSFSDPTNYSAKNIRKAHSSIDLKDADFETFTEHLIYSLEELNVPGNLIDEVIAFTLNVKKDVINND
ncbi:group 1 truncated hemoglobin [Aurantibacter crassamenti]|uniref:group I truncated hemoglobin n=1 Tax=Aurantibacter crassamenti TaxID=1837375 RepID=UPI00193AC360|nr:group 1 truncated hemoglobin [Aurantibacter crassamenti]MBM1107746.1 group 1 truncated hemoglobin [Aurantibacter crassamenti]